MADEKLFVWGDLRGEMAQLLLRFPAGSIRTTEQRQALKVLCRALIDYYTRSVDPDPPSFVDGPRWAASMRYLALSAPRVVGEAVEFALASPDERTDPDG